MGPPPRGTRTRPRCCTATARPPGPGDAPGRSAPLQAADAEGSSPGFLPGFLCLTDVVGRVFVHGRDSGEIARLVSRERDRELMAPLQPGQPAEVGQALPFLLGHMITVGQVRPGDRREPLVGADLMT